MLPQMLCLDCGQTYSVAVVEELYETPSLEEVSKTIDSLRTGKASGMDRIPAEVIKSAKAPLLEHLHALLCQCWEEGDLSLIHI